MSGNQQLTGVTQYTTPASTSAQLNALWSELLVTVRHGYTGQLILHCNDGRVMKVEGRRFWRVEDAVGK